MDRHIEKAESIESKYTVNHVDHFSFLHSKQPEIKERGNAIISAK
jgi:hypothetical protein